MLPIVIWGVRWTRKCSFTYASGTTISISYESSSYPT
jgi:hypothetical protein